MTCERVISSSIKHVFVLMVLKRDDHNNAINKFNENNKQHNSGNRFASIGVFLIKGRFFSLQSIIKKKKEKEKEKEKKKKITFIMSLISALSVLSILSIDWMIIIQLSIAIHVARYYYKYFTRPSP